MTRVRISRWRPGWIVQPQSHTSPTSAYKTRCPPKNKIILCTQNCVEYFHLRRWKNKPSLVPVVFCSAVDSPSNAKPFVEVYLFFHVASFPSLLCSWTSQRIPKISALPLLSSSIQRLTWSALYLVGAPCRTTARPCVDIAGRWFLLRFPLSCWLVCSCRLAAYRRGVACLRRVSVGGDTVVGLDFAVLILTPESLTWLCVDST